MEIAYLFDKAFIQIDSKILEVAEKAYEVLNNYCNTFMEESKFSVACELYCIFNGQGSEGSIERHSTALDSVNHLMDVTDDERVYCLATLRIIQSLQNNHMFMLMEKVSKLEA